MNKKSNFHPTQLKLVGERIAKNVGANHQIGKLIEEYCIKYNIKYRLIRPTAHKWTSEQCFKFTGIKEKNQDVIDAIRLVFGR